LEKNAICEKEEVSEKFITKIIFGRVNEFDDFIEPTIPN
jgi:hypothetical protein